MKNDLAPKTMQAGLTGRKLSRDRKKNLEFYKYNYVFKREMYYSCISLYKRWSLTNFHTF